MSTFTDSLQAQITALDAQLTAISPVSVGSDGVTITNNRFVELSNHRLKLESLLQRASGNRPMIVRGRVKGLAHGRV